MSKKSLDCYATLENYTVKKRANDNSSEEPNHHNNFPKAHEQAEKNQQLQNKPPLLQEPEPAENYIEPLDSDRLYELLTDSRYFYIKNGSIPAKLVIKCETNKCKPCHTINPFFQMLAKDPRFADKLLFIRIDVDKMKQNLRSLFGELNVVPTFFYFVAGKKIAMTVGGNREEIEKNCLNLLQN